MDDNDRMLLYDTLGQGKGGPEWRACLDGCDARLLEPMLRVAHRMWLIDGLQYGVYIGIDMRMEDAHTAPIRHASLLEGLVLYLLATCVDALCTAPPYSAPPQFQEWLNSPASAMAAERVLERLVPGSESDPTTRISALRRTVGGVYAEYQKQGSMSRAFREYFLRLPSAVADVLVGAFPVVRRRVSKSEPPYIVHDAQPEWDAFPAEKKLDRIARYFYEYRRCAFTHASVSERGGGWSHRVPPLPYSFPGLPLQENGVDNSEYTLPATWTLRGVDRGMAWYHPMGEAWFGGEEEILRMVIYFGARQQLGCECTQETVEGFGRWLIRRTTLAGLIRETREIRGTLSWYEAAASDERIQARCINAGLPSLPTAWAQAAIERGVYYTDIPFEQGVPDELQRHVELLTQIGEPIRVHNADMAQSLRSDERLTREQWLSRIQATCETVCELAERLVDPRLMKILNNNLFRFLQPPPGP